MNSRRLIVVSGAVLCAAALAVRWYASRMDAAAQRTLAALPSQRASLAQLVSTASARLASAERERARLQTKLDGLRAEKSVPLALPGANSKEKPLPPGVPPANWREQLLNNPELLAMLFSSNRPLLTRSFGPFYLARRLSPAKIEKLEAAFFKRDEQLTDLEAAQSALGPEVASAVAAFRKRVGEEFDATLRAVLGPEDWPHFQEFQRMAPARSVLKEVAANATFDHVPLTPAQGEQLMRVMAQASAAYARGGSTDLRTIDWEVVDAQAPLVLSPAQCALLKRSSVRCEAQLDEAIARALKADRQTKPAQGGGPRS